MTSCAVVTGRRPTRPQPEGHTLLAAQGADEPPATYDRDVDKRQYIESLHGYDQHRDPTELATIVMSRPIGE